MAANKIADFNTLKELLHLSPDENGDKRLNELLAAFGSEFEYAEKVFVILYKSYVKILLKNESIGNCCRWL